MFSGQSVIEKIFFIPALWTKSPAKKILNKSTSSAQKVIEYYWLKNLRLLVKGPSQKFLKKIHPFSSKGPCEILIKISSFLGFKNQRILN